MIIKNGRKALVDPWRRWVKVASAVHRHHDAGDRLLQGIQGDLRRQGKDSYQGAENKGKVVCMGRGVVTAAAQLALRSLVWCRS